MYHYTRDLKHSRYPEIKGLDLALFRQQTQYMKENFNIVTVEQVISVVEGSCDILDNALLLIFNDGCMDKYVL